MLVCRYIYSDRTPFDKLPDKYFCPGKNSSQFFLVNSTCAKISDFTRFFIQKRTDFKT